MPIELPKKFYKIGHRSHPSWAEASSGVIEYSTIVPKIEGLNAATGTGEERERER